MMNWLQKMFYTLSGHDARQESWDQEMALRNMRDRCIEIGRNQVPAPIMSQGTCPKHPIVLLNNKGHGDYTCMMCKDEDRNTDRLPAQVYTQERRRGAGPQTAVQQTMRLTQKLKGDT